MGNTLTLTAGAVAFMFLVGSSLESQDLRPLEMPRYHHIHINATNPERSLDWYATYWPAGRKTTVAGFPAFQGGDLYLMYSKVAQQAPGGTVGQAASGYRGRQRSRCGDRIQQRQQARIERCTAVSYLPDELGNQSHYASKYIF